VARLMNEDGQWIVLMGFIISIMIFFLAIIVNQSVLVGQTTAESVLDFPKSDIQDLRSEVFESNQVLGGSPDIANIREDIKALSLSRKYAVVNISNTSDTLTINYNNGVTSYYEKIQL